MSTEPGEDQSVLVAVSACIAMVCACGGVHASQVLPRISDVDRKLITIGPNRILDGVGQWVVGNAVPMIKSPVHEAITLNALGCTVASGDERNCVTTEAVAAHQVILYGVRWPDDPPFSLDRTSPPRIVGCNPGVTLRSTAQPKCWQGLFADAAKTAGQNVSAHPDRPAFDPGDNLLARSHFGDLQFFHSLAAQVGELAAVVKGE